MPTTYQVRFVPGKFTYTEERTISPPHVRYFGIYIDGINGIVAQTQDENTAKFICLSCELANSYVAGDGSATRELMLQLLKLRDLSTGAS